MMKQMQGNQAASPKKGKVPIVPIAIGVAVVALVAALALKKGGAGKS
ncbi:MAG: hypothetical protein HYU66_05405, partial [Armatimonadetes bacterium]|nr:hypothetical protein [Armatimonadota bacterium]